jgi:hypothetical protein
MPNEAETSIKPEPAALEPGAAKTGDTIRAFELEALALPIIHGSAILARLLSCRDDEPIGLDYALEWFADDLHNQAEELRAVMYRQAPRWHTSAAGDGRAEIIAKHCPEPTPPASGFWFDMSKPQ